MFFQKQNGRRNKDGKFWRKTIYITWTNKMVDDLLSSRGNFKALMNLKGKNFDGDRQAQ